MDTWLQSEQSFSIHAVLPLRLRWTQVIALLPFYAGSVPCRKVPVAMLRLKHVC